MKAVSVFPGTKTFKIVEHEAPRLSQPDQVMLRMLDNGICGTDREICSFEYGTTPEGHDYLVIGHESLAQVEEVGSGNVRFLEARGLMDGSRREATLSELSGVRDDLLKLGGIGESDPALQQAVEHWNEGAGPSARNH